MTQHFKIENIVYSKKLVKTKKFAYIGIYFFIFEREEIVMFNVLLIKYYSKFIEKRNHLILFNLQMWCFIILENLNSRQVYSNLLKYCYSLCPIDCQSGSDHNALLTINAQNQLKVNKYLKVNEATFNTLIRLQFELFHNIVISLTKSHSLGNIANF